MQKTRTVPAAFTLREALQVEQAQLVGGGHHDPPSVGRARRTNSGARAREADVRVLLVGARADPDQGEHASSRPKKATVATAARRSFLDSGSRRPRGCGRF